MHPLSLTLFLLQWVPVLPKLALRCWKHLSIPRGTHIPGHPSKNKYLLENSELFWKVVEKKRILHTLSWLKL